MAIVYSTIAARSNVMENYVNARGNKVYCEPCGENCHDIGMMCRPEYGWSKYETDRDDFFFGIWTNGDQNQIITLISGEFSVIECDGDVAFQEEIDCLYALFGNTASVTEDAGKFAINDLVAYGGRRGTIHNKNWQTDLGWVYQIHFDDQAEWVSEGDLFLV